MDDAPPPTVHVLRPHHISVLTILVLLFKNTESSRVSADFLLYLYRLVLAEVSEVSHPRSYQELMNDINAGMKPYTDDAMRFLPSIKTMHAELKSAEKITSFFANLPPLFLEKHDDDQPVFLRRSIFGYFCRRSFVTFIKLSYSGVVKLQKDYQAWRSGDHNAGYETIQKDQLSNSADNLIFKTQADKKSWAKADTYEIFEHGWATGDENIATENLRRFFEQHFHENNDSGVRHHALLSLVRMHYMRNEFIAARKLLLEAITVARTSGDKIALQHCISMLHRLPPVSPGTRPVINEVQPNLHPLEILFDVSKLLDSSNEQPLSAAFVKLSEAIGLYDHWLDVQPSLPMEDVQWAQHGVQSLVWCAAGCPKLAAIEETIVMTFAHGGGDDQSRVTIFLNRAYRLARQGEYKEALLMLLHPCVWHGISLDDYTFWSLEIWHILALRATRRGQDLLFYQYLLPHRPPGDYNPREYFNSAASTIGNSILDPLYEVIQMRQNDQAFITMEQLLMALWRSEFLMHLADYRTGIVLLADICMQFGISEKCNRLIDDVMPQIMDGSDLENRAFACFTFARCVINAAANNTSDITLKEAIPYLLIAEADYKQLHMNRPLQDVQYLVSVLYYNIGMTKEQNDASQRHMETSIQLANLGEVVVDKEMQKIMEAVSFVGAALAGRCTIKTA